MDSIVQFSAAFRRAPPSWLIMSTARGMNLLKAKRILTGLPDDRKNVFSSTGAARQKNNCRLFYYPFRRITRNRLTRRRAPAHFPKGSHYDHPSTDSANRRELVRGLGFRRRSVASIPWPAIRRRRRGPATPR